MNKIDANLYSRQISTYGMDTMVKINKLKIIIVGMRGLGIEISKNIILTGINEVSIFDDNICSIADLSSNFYINENHINKKRRDEACIESLRDLNREINVNKFETLEIMKKNIKNYDILIITEMFDYKTIIEFNDICREKNIKFIYAATLGLSGFVFNDFGEDHIIINKTGDEPQSFFIKNITKEKEGKVTINRDKDEISLYEFSDYVIFKNIEGMTELNNKELKIIKILDLNTFTIGDTSNYKDYISGGVVKEIYIPYKKKFQKFKDSFFNPFTEHLLGQSINMKKGKKEYYHICLIAIHYFLSIHNHLPEINDKNHILEIKKLVNLIINIGNNKDWINKIKIIDDKYLENIVRWCKCSISPVCSFLGGIISQEIIKITGKYNPISQWLYFDFFEKIENLDLNRDMETINSRYDDQISIFGKNIQERLSNLNLFMIGAGALGCEFLKIFSLMGIGTSKNKYITITDNDKIEMSNLNRQFLFKKKDNGYDKSEIACREAKKINNKINFRNESIKVSFETENIFNDNFWEEQDLIIGAVDNDKARRYIDNQCTFYNKIFLESGTSGTSASSMIIYPHVTTCYDDLEKVITKDIPMCTLKNFPSQIEHCIEFSKIYFSEFFEKNIEDLNSCIKDALNYFQKIENTDTEKKDIIEKLEEIEKLIILYDKNNILNFIEYSLEKYYILFNKNISNLITKIPSYALNEKGEPFWRGSKLMPHPIDFDIKDNLSKNFIIYFILITKRILNINLTINEKEIINNCSDIYEKYKSEYNGKNKLLSEEEQKEYIEAKKLEIIKLINESGIKDKNFNSEKFEKDNDELFHVDFLFCFSNLRARNYNIEECDKEKVRKVAGNIIPAIVSTTSCIAGFVAMQIYSAIISNDINLMRNIGLDLGSSWYSIGRPEEVKLYDSITKINNNLNLIKISPKFSIWDTIPINGPITAKKLINIFREEYNVEIDCINANNKCILDLIENEENNDDIYKTIDELYFQSFTVKSVNRKYLKLEIIGTKNDIDIKIPRIKYVLRMNN